MSTEPALLAQFTQLDTATVSDALDACGLPPGQGGLRPMWGRPRVAGFAVTVEVEPLSGQPDAQPPAERGGAHILTEAIAGAGPEDVIVVANGGRTDVSSCGWRCHGCPGDVVMADEDGIVVVPRERAAEASAPPGAWPAAKPRSRRRYGAESRCRRRCGTPAWPERRRRDGPRCQGRAGGPADRRRRPRGRRGQPGRWPGSRRLPARLRLDEGGLP